MSIDFPARDALSPLLSMVSSIQEKMCGQYSVQLIVLLWPDIEQEKDTFDFEPSCFFQVDEYGFFIHWKSEPRVNPLKNHRIYTEMIWI